MVYTLRVTDQQLRCGPIRRKSSANQLERKRLQIPIRLPGYTVNRWPGRERRVTAGGEEGLIGLCSSWPACEPLTTFTASSRSLASLAS